VVIEPGENFSMQDILDGLVKYKQSTTPEVSDHFVFTITDSDGGMAADQEFTLFQHVINITLTGEEKFDASGLSVYPNPGEGLFRVSGSDGADSYEIYSASGRIIRADLIDQNSEVQIDIRDEAAGIYLLQVKKDSRLVASYRLIVE